MPSTIAFDPEYVPNQYSTSTLLTIISSTFMTLMLSIWVTVRRNFAEIGFADQLKVVWFGTCGIMHLGFEGYYVLNYTTIASQNHILAQLWKEYSLADSRYLANDSNIFCLEVIAVFCLGPVALITAWLTACHDPRRHVLQAIVCTGHLYGVIFYYSTSLLTMSTGDSHCRPEWLYVWVYFFGMNLPWAIIPAVLLYGNIMDTKKAGIQQLKSM